MERPQTSGKIISFIISMALSFWATVMWGLEVSKPEIAHSFMFMKDLDAFQLFVCWWLLVNAAEIVRR